ncbi:MAG TPA: MFS transporter [Thermoguttaceae bacterium]|nr:MFS transporter [Thermoguttaceae bacterium]
MANTAVMVAIALLYRYADFVTLLGGTELHLGWIVGVGMVGSLLMRLLLGTAIDRWGARLVWLSSLVVFSASCFGHLAVADFGGPAVYLLRIAYCSAVAGIMGAAMTFIAGRAPVARMAEMIGMLGTSGFFGIVLGTQLGDLLLGTETIERWQVDRMFLVAGTLGLCAVTFVWGATRHEPRPKRRRRPPLLWLLRRYFPGTVLLVGVATGIGTGLPTTFLRPYAAQLDISRIGLFFGVYAPAAILTRILTRRLPERLGLAPMILAGLGTLIVGQLLLVLVGSEWTFVLPGIAYGVGHAMLVPSVIAAGSRAFPNRHRGLGTTLILSMFDLGNVVGAPMAGAIVHFGGAVGLPGYPIMFVSVAAALGLAGVVYGLTGRVPTVRHPNLARVRSRRVGAQAGECPLVEVGTEA